MSNDTPANPNPSPLAAGVPVAGNGNAPDNVVDAPQVPATEKPPSAPGKKQDKVADASPAPEEKDNQYWSTRIPWILTGISILVA